MKLIATAATAACTILVLTGCSTPTEDAQGATRQADSAPTTEAGTPDVEAATSVDSVDMGTFAFPRDEPTLVTRNPLAETDTIVVDSRLNVSVDATSVTATSLHDPANGWTRDLDIAGTDPDVCTSRETLNDGRSVLLHRTAASNDAAAEPQGGFGDSTNSPHPRVLTYHLIDLHTGDVIARNVLEVDTDPTSGCRLERAGDLLWIEKRVEYAPATDAWIVNDDTVDGLVGFIGTTADALLHVVDGAVPTVQALTIAAPRTVKWEMPSGVGDPTHRSTSHDAILAGDTVVWRGEWETTRGYPPERFVEFVGIDAATGEVLWSRTEQLVGMSEIRSGLATAGSAALLSWNDDGAWVDVRTGDVIDEPVIGKFENAERIPSQFDGRSVWTDNDNRQVTYTWREPGSEPEMSYSAQLHPDAADKQPMLHQMLRSDEYVISTGTFLYAFDPTSREELWNIDLSDLDALPEGAIVSRVYDGPEGLTVNLRLGDRETSETWLLSDV